MQFRQGAEVFMASGEKIGHIDRIVLDPATDEVTHLVVEKGLLLKEGKVVPMSMVGPSRQDKVTLREDAEDLKKLPDFEEEHYIWRNEDSQAQSDRQSRRRQVYQYPPVGARGTISSDTSVALEPMSNFQTEKNIPKDAVALQKGAKVFGSDGEHIGDLERIFTDPLQDRATHFLISEGLILKERKLIPIQWITNIIEDQVHLSVSSGFVENLPKYRPAS
jgi:uncharacterized protein YrrD